MRRVIAFMLLAALAASMDSAQAAGPPADHALLQRGAVSDDLPAPANSHERQDTLWFGGDNGSGLAVLGERWNFQTPGSNGFQGCISWDETADPGVYFGRVTASSFTSTRMMKSSSVCLKSPKTWLVPRSVGLVVVSWMTEL